MEEKFNLVLELFYIPKGSRVKRLLSQREYFVHDEITLNDPELKDIKTVTPWKDSRFLIPVNSNGSIESAGMKEKFILENLSKDEAKRLIDAIDIGYF